jgi:hypothetical protein
MTRRRKKWACYDTLQSACAEVKYQILHIRSISSVVSHNAIVLSHKKPSSVVTLLISCRSEENDKQKARITKISCIFAYTDEHYSPKCSSVFVTIKYS